MKEKIEAGSMPNMSDMQWWASSIENWVKAPINAVGGWLGTGTDWSTDWKSNKEINKEIQKREQREHALADYYKYKKKGADDFKRWSEENPDKKEYGDMIDKQNVKDTVINLVTNNKQDSLVLFGVFSLGLVLIINILK